MAKIGIIGAMESEVKGLIEASNIKRTEKRAEMTFYEGTLNQTDVVIVQCGMGKVNAGICVQILADLFNVTHIINTGVAGSLNNHLNIGDIVVSRELIQHDYDVSPIGFQKSEIPYTGLVRIPADEKLCMLVKNAAKDVLTTEHAVEGLILSGDQFIASKEEKTALIEEYHGDCAEMEGAAVAQACYLNGIPFVVVRAISDKADDSGHMSFEEFAAKAAVNSANIVKEIISKI